MKLSLAILFCVGCAPNLGPSASLLSDDRVLAVQAMPAEVVPGNMVTFTALFAGPMGDLSGSPILWSWCTAPKPLTEENTVATECVTDSAVLVDVGMGAMISATVPGNACALFGPDPPPQAAGQPALRPRDPDVTGGYYQPLRVDDGEGISFELERVICDLANASADIATQFNMEYKPNNNPTLTSVTLDAGGAPVTLDAVPAGVDITLTASWDAASAETYTLFDPTSRTLTTAREAVTVSWFITAGTTTLDKSGRSSTETETFATNTWHTPTAGGSVNLYVVLRDDRGGVSWQKLVATVQ